MKNQLNNNTKKNTFTKYFILLFALSFVMISCKKEIVEVETLSDDEFVETVESSYKSDDGGTSSDVVEVVKVTEDYYSSCGYTKDSTITISGAQGLYSNSTDFKLTVTCTGNIPNNAELIITGTNEFNGPKLEMDASTSGTISLTNLVSGTEYIVNGSIAKNGTSVFTSRNDSKTVTSNITFAITDLNINKTNYDAISGTIDVSLSGSSNGNSINRTADMTINNNNTATLVLDNGNSYTINL